MAWLRRLPLMNYPGAIADMFRLAAWIVSLLLLIGLLWTATETEIARDEQAERKLAISQMATLASTYAVQLEDLTAQIDRMTLAIAVDWEEAPRGMNLQRERIRSLLPRQHEFQVAVIGADGRALRSSSLHNLADTSQSSYFSRHAAGCCDGLLVTRAPTGTGAVGSAIRFSRRLNRPDSSFGGVVVISSAPDFLVTLQGDALHGTDSFVTALLEDGTMLGTRIGNRMSNEPLLRSAFPQHGQERGVQLMNGDQFVDGRARYVSWQRAGSFGLIAVAGATEEAVLAPHRLDAHGYRVAASIGTLFLVLLGLGGIGISVHVARRHRADEEVRATYRMATDAANEGFYMLSPLLSEWGKLTDLLIRDCNNRAAALLGLTRSQLVGRCARDVMPYATRRDLLAICSKALAQGVCEDELRVPVHGGIRATWLSRRAVHSGSGIALTLSDISEVKAHQQVLADLANTDALTALPNRRWLTDFLPAALRRASKFRHRVAVLFIDLDHFKNVNDTLGHEAGDALLLQAAARIADTVRAGDRVARLGGDEFTVVLEDIASDAEVRQMAEAIIARLSEPFSLASAVGSRMSASIGVSLFPDHGDDADALLKHADVAMYAAKAAGRGCHYLYHASLSELLMQRLADEHALRLAIERGEFVVHYQPRVSAVTGRICSVEALVRWQNPQRGLVPPSEFIDIAEEAGLIVPISEFVIAQVGEQLSQWRALGMRMVPVSVNVSPRQLEGGNTSLCLARVLHEHQLPASLLEVEITESAMVDRGSATTRELDAIRALGIRLMIDDFGTGYSSLAQLHRLDVDVLKVDQAFTRSLAQASEGELLYRAIVSMAAALNIRVVAEGVETHAQLRLLQDIGCDEIQGFIISPAVPPAAIARLVQAGGLHPFAAASPRCLPGLAG